MKLTYHTKQKQPQCLGLGVFDGIHQGHKVILDRCDHLLTFDPHPAVIIKQISCLYRLTTLTEMTYYIPNLISLHFTTEIANLSALDFLNHVIKERINPKSLIIGYDYYFGKNRSGTPDLLKKWADQENIPIQIINPISYKNTIVKSKAIREQMLSGEFNKAIASLGHSYLMIGMVVKGDQRGRSLGFPTANLEFPANKLIPNHGVYKGTVQINNKTYNAMIYIGNKPTFNQQKASVEAFILDFNGNLYDQYIYLFIESFIRAEQQFSSQSELIHQIKKDIHHAFDH